MRWLGQQIATLTGAISRQVAALAFRQPSAAFRQPSVAATVGGLDPTPKLVGLFGGLLSTLVGKITVALAPLALLGAAIGSPTSGFGVFLSAVKLLGGTLGAVLLPGFLALSALVYAVSGYISESLLPVLKDWYQAVIDHAISAAQLFEAALVYAVRKVREFGEWLGKFNKEVGEDANDEPLGWISRNNPIRILTGMTPEEIRERRAAAARGEKPPETEFGRILEDIRARGKAGDKAGGQPAPGGFVGRFLEGLRASMDEFRFQNAPPARFVAGSDLYREAQLAAVNVSPFEKKAQDFMGQVLQVLDEIAGNLPQPALAE